VKVASRLTVATALFALLASSTYAFFDVRGRGRERRAAIEQQAKAVAASLRLGLERLPAAQLLSPDAGTIQQLNSVASGWQVDLVSRNRALEPESDLIKARQNRLLRTFLDVPNLGILDEAGGRLFHAVAVRVPSAQPDVTEVVGLLEVSRPLQGLSDLARKDVLRALLLILLFTIIITLALGSLVRSLVTRPIIKLLRGVDDVAKGDLSHVLLSERDDEVGAIATRFNEMTLSLRESRAETLRQNEAKLGLEQRLGHSEKLATIGQLAAEIAHEVGTPLGVIAGRARTTVKKCDDPVAVVKNAEIIAEQTARITKIIQRLLDFTRRKVGVAESSEVALDDVVQTTLDLMSGQFSAHKIKTQHRRAVPVARAIGDADRLQQVFINLILNGVQAMPNGGGLELNTSTVMRARPGLEDAGIQPFVQFEVRDHGPGIAVELRDRIFDPFFTTKDEQGGTGLGLAVCVGIVKEHDGWIEIDDAEGGGAVFRVVLPATNPIFTEDRRSITRGVATS
jgi:signal transduction histidine kinase